MDLLAGHKVVWHKIAGLIPRCGGRVSAEAIVSPPRLPLTEGGGVRSMISAEVVCSFTIILAIELA